MTAPNRNAHSFLDRFSNRARRSVPLPGGRVCPIVGLVCPASIIVRLRSISGARMKVQFSMNMHIRSISASHSQTGHDEACPSSWGNADSRVLSVAPDSPTRAIRSSASIHLTLFQVPWRGGIRGFPRGRFVFSMGVRGFPTGDWSVQRGVQVRVSKAEGCFQHRQIRSPHLVSSCNFSPVGGARIVVPGPALRTTTPVLFAFVVHRLYRNPLLSS